MIVIQIATATVLGIASLVVLLSSELGPDVVLAVLATLS
jgi:hypothetical protein